MPRTRKRPCRNCLRWFYPDPQVGDRQRSCGKPECQAVRRQKTQASWRRRNPSYAAGYRIDQRHSEPASDPEPLRVPAPLQKLPWDIAKDQFGGKGVEFIMVMDKYLLRAAKDQSSGYPIDLKGVPNRKRMPPEKVHEILLKGSGTHFDRLLVQIFLTRSVPSFDQRPDLERLSRALGEGNSPGKVKAVGA
jgi:hypothetical protein